MTCLVTAYNYERWVGSAIESALAQTWPSDRLEVLVIDDGSTDGTPEAIAPYRDRIRYVRQGNAGLISSTNRGIAEARGEFVALLDADDEWLPDKVARQVELMERDPDVALVFGDMQLVDADGRLAQPSYYQHFQMEPPAGAALGPFMARNWAPAPTIMLRRAVAPAMWPIPPGAPCQDWWMAVMACTVGKVDVVRSPVTRYRIHGGNMSSIGNGDERWLRTQEDDLRFRRWMFRHLDLGRISLPDLVTAWRWLESAVVMLSQRRQKSQLEVFPVGTAETLRCGQLTAAALATFNRGETGRGARLALRAMAENPFAGEPRTVLTSAQEIPEGTVPWSDSPAPNENPFTVVCHAEEVLNRPYLVAAFAHAFPRAGQAALVFYAPDGDEARLAPRLEAVLAGAGLLDDGAADVTLLCVPAAEGDAALAGGRVAVLTEAPPRSALEYMPHVSAATVSVLSELAGGPVGFV